MRLVRKRVGFNIHRLRAHQKMTLKKLAVLSGLSAERLDAYELGKNEIQLDHMVKIACALNDDVCALFGERKETEKKI